MRCLVTGAAGFIGTHTVAALRAAGHEVIGIDRFLPQVHEGCIGRDDPALVTTTVGHHAGLWAANSRDDIDTVIHLAAAVGVGQSQYQPAHYVEQNVLETARLWEAIIAHRATVRKVVVASSMSVLGEGDYRTPTGTLVAQSSAVRLVRAPLRGCDAFDLLWSDGKRYRAPDLTPVPTREDKRPEPASVYALSKLDTERYSLLLGQTYAVPTVALRLFNTYGPGQALANPYTGVLMQFACRVLNGQRPIVYEDGQQLRDFIYVGDVVQAILAAAAAPDLGGVFNVCTGIGTTVGGLAEQWCALAGDGLTPEITGRIRAGDVRACIGDPGLLERATGWRAQWSLIEGLQWTLACLRDEGITPADYSARANAELETAGLLSSPTATLQGES